MGDLDAARNIPQLNRNKIKAVLTVAAGSGINYEEHSGVHYHQIIPADDISSYDLSRYFEPAFEFIEKYRKMTNVFIHCFAGISRSTTIVISYIMKKYNMSLRDSYTLVLNKRDIICPNPGFAEQLKCYENHLRSKSTRQCLSPNVREDEMNKSNIHYNPQYLYRYPFENKTEEYKSLNNISVS